MPYGSNDDRPQRRRSRRRRGRGPGVGVWVALAGLAVLVVVGGVVAVVVSRKGGRNGAGGPPGTGVAGFFAPGRAAHPAGWKEYAYADAGFKACFPTEPGRKSDEGLGIVGEGGKGLMIEYSANAIEDETLLTVCVYTRRVPPHIPLDRFRELLFKEFNNPVRFQFVGLRLIESRSVSWMGHQVKEFWLTHENGRRNPHMVDIQRCVVTDAYEIHAGISMEDGRKLAPRLVDGFFDNIQPLK